MNKNSNRVFDHVFIIMFENEYRSYVMQNEYFKGLAQQGTDMANYFGVFHPSQTNYISSLAAELCNVADDDRPATLLPQDTMVDLIEKSPYKLDWRAYMDSYIPQNQAWTPDLVPKDEYPYVIKHNAFSSFAKIVRNEERWKKIGNEADLFADLLNGTLPEYSWFTPNMWNDGHYLDGTNPDAIPADKAKQPIERAPTLVDQAARYLQGLFERLKFPGPDSHFPPNTLVVVTYDEADFEASYDTKAKAKYYYDGPNQIYTVLLGDMIKPGTVSYEGYNHYSLIKTIEQNFSLGDLGKNDKEANWFRFLWDETWMWEAPEETPLQTDGHITSAALGDTLYVVYDASGGELNFSTLDANDWGEPQKVGITTTGDLAMGAITNGTSAELVLAYVDGANNLSTISYSAQKGWSATPQILDEGVSKVTIGSFNDGTELMIAYSTTAGELKSIIYSGGEWGSHVFVGFESTGDLQLAVLGPSIYLIFEDTTNPANKNEMMVCSYNTADFNVVTPATSQYNGPQNDTTKDLWSPSVFPVQHFSSAFLGDTQKGTTPTEKEPVSQPYLGSGPFAAATLDGVLRLVHPGVNNNLLLTEEFSIHGILTPKLPVSYDPSPEYANTTNDGYGTLAEAGWSVQNPINGAHMSKVATMATVDGEMVLLYDNPEGHLDMVRGSYY